MNKVQIKKIEDFIGKSSDSLKYVYFKEIT